MSNTCVKYFCFTIVSCCFIISLSNVFKLFLNKELKELDKMLEPVKLEQEPINLEELLMPKEIFPKVPLPQMDQNSYAEK